MFLYTDMYKYTFFPLGQNLLSLCVWYNIRSLPGSSAMFAVKAMKKLIPSVLVSNTSMNIDYKQPTSDGQTHEIKQSNKPYVTMKTKCCC